MNSRLFLYSVIFVLASITPAVAEPTSIRIAVIDTSKSMDGVRLATVKTELAEHAKKYPPSAANPLTVVLFNDTVREVRSFTEAPAFQSYLPTLTACGGTSIASGLRRAVEEARKHSKAAHVVVLLYTDGEDGDQAGIDAAEEELNRLFTERSRVGLAQTVVFCKRWGGANAELMAAIAKRGQAAVIDGGEAALQSVLLTPHVKVKDVRWSTSHPGTAEVTLEGWVEGDSALPADAPLVRLTCPAAPTDSPSEVGTKPTAFTLRVNVSRADVLARKATVDLVATAKGAVKHGAGVLWPMVGQPQLQVTVPLPKPFRAVYTVLVTPSPATWHDPLNEIADVPMQVSITVTPSADEGTFSTLPFSIVPDADVTVASGVRDFAVAGTGVTTQTLTVRAGPKHLRQTSKGLLYEIGLTIGPRELPVQVAFDPPTLRIPVQVPMPSPVQTTLAVKVVSAKCLGWANVVRGTAAFQADIEVEIRGVVPPGSLLKANGNADLLELRFGATPVRAGTQRLRLNGEATFAPERSELASQWTTTVPKRHGAVEWLPPPATALKLTAPPPARLLLKSLDAKSKGLAVSVPAFADDTTLMAQLDVQGVLRPERAGAVAGIKSDSAALRDVPATMLAPARLVVRVRPPDGPRSFFRDSVTLAEVTVDPATPNQRLVGGTFTVRIHQEAPFKRLVFYLVVGLGAIAAMYCLIRTFGRLTRSPRTDPTLFAPAGKAK